MLRFDCPDASCRMRVCAGIVKLLLAANADRNVACDGMRPIDLARRQNKPEVVALLAEKEPAWGSGKPRTTPAGETGISDLAIKASKAGEPESDKVTQDPWEAKKKEHRARLLELKDLKK